MATHQFGMTQHDYRAIETGAEELFDYDVYSADLRAVRLAAEVRLNTPRSSRGTSGAEDAEGCGGPSALGEDRILSVSMGAFNRIVLPQPSATPA